MKADKAPARDDSVPLWVVGAALMVWIASVLLAAAVYADASFW